jgi:hypothetical protein
LRACEALLSQIDSGSEDYHLVDATEQVKLAMAAVIYPKPAAFGYYWVWYEGAWIIGEWDGEDWELINGVITSRRHVIRGPRILQPRAFAWRAGKLDNDAPQTGPA